MVIHETVPDEFGQRKHNLGRTYNGEKITWLMIITEGMKSMEKLVGVQVAGKGEDK
ncbi:MAG: hypothetical protein LBI42_06415 [Chitinispirillales bacterium]|jgi:hypothetical protein|nr:hypothetical protein [Chitinispirillales bacterium]